jgi:hypothetical protein
MDDRFWAASEQIRDLNELPKPGSPTSETATVTYLKKVQRRLESMAYMNGVLHYLGPGPNIGYDSAVRWKRCGDHFVCGDDSRMDWVAITVGGITAECLNNCGVPFRKN